MLKHAKEDLMKIGEREARKKLMKLKLKERKEIEEEEGEERLETKKN